MSIGALILIILVVCILTGYGGYRGGLDPIWILLIILALLVLSGGGFYFFHGGF